MRKQNNYDYHSKPNHFKLKTTDFHKCFKNSEIAMVRRVGSSKGSGASKHRIWHTTQTENCCNSTKEMGTTKWGSASPIMDFIEQFANY